MAVTVTVTESNPSTPTFPTLTSTPVPSCRAIIFIGIALGRNNYILLVIRLVAIIFIGIALGAKVVRLS